MARGKISEKSKGNGKRKKFDSLKVYIYRVLRGLGSRYVHFGSSTEERANGIRFWAGLGISKKGMDVMESFVKDIFERIALEAAELARGQKRATLGVADIQAAVKLAVPGLLGEHADAEGMLALNKYKRSILG